MAIYSEWALQRNKFLIFIAFVCCLFSKAAYPQNSDTAAHKWNGEWVAEGTIFRIEVEIEGSRLVVHQIESLGFEWTNEAGEIEGNVAKINVRYAGVEGVIQAEFIDETTASVFAASCAPDYMVVCLLAKDQKAVFKKISPSI